MTKSRLMKLLAKLKNKIKNTNTMQEQVQNSLFNSRPDKISFIIKEKKSKCPKLWLITITKMNEMTPKSISQYGYKQKY